MQKRHSDRKAYFQEQVITTEKHIIPYIEDLVSITKSSRVLEIGCGEGGNLIPFLKRGCEAVGIDINGLQIEKAATFIKEALPESTVTLFHEDIYDIDENRIGRFDIIMLRDVIEHIPNQNNFMKHLKLLLKPKGKVFFGFPPWRMPFGGHQQVCQSNFLSKLPYFHLFNRDLYRFILKSFGETQGTIKGLLEIKETGISIKRFEKIVQSNGYTTDKKTLYLINPNYETKFNFKSKKQFNVLRSLPYFKDFFTTCYYCILSIKTTKENK